MPISGKETGGLGGLALKQPIRIPELFVGDERFTLTSSDWGCWLTKLQQLGAEVRVHTRQHLEDCETQTTDIISTQGILIFRGESFVFVAQIDDEGFGLYIEIAARTSVTAKELLSHLHAHFPAPRPS